MSRSPLLLYGLALEAMETLLAVGQRSALALIGIVIGTAAVIAMLDIGHGAEMESIRQFRAMGPDLLVAQGAFDQRPTATVARAIADLPRTLPAAIRRAAPLAMTGLTLGRDEGLLVTLVGTTAALAPIGRLPLAEGRFFTRFDDREDAPGLFAVIGATIARSRALSPVPLHPGDRIRLGFYFFTVIGVLADSAQNPLLPIDTDRSIFLPIASLHRAAPTLGISTLVATVANPEAPEVATVALSDYLHRLWGGPPTQIRSARQLIEGMRHQARIMSLLLAAVGGVCLLVGGVGVMNVMLMNVAERRQEIGLRQALGARRSHIRTLFLMEAALLSLTGGVCGTGIGTLVAFLHATLSGWSFAPSPLALPLGSLISLGIGLFFGAYPAARAARLDPVETLRSA